MQALRKVFTILTTDDSSPLCSSSSSGSGIGDVNISAILNSFQMGYDKRVRPNYGGKTVTQLVQIGILGLKKILVMSNLLLSNAELEWVQLSSVDVYGPNRLYG